MKQTIFNKLWSVIISVLWFFTYSFNTFWYSLRHWCVSQKNVVTPYTLWLANVLVCWEPLILVSLTMTSLMEQLPIWGTIKQQFMNTQSSPWKCWASYAVHLCRHQAPELRIVLHMPCKKHSNFTSAALIKTGTWWTSFFLYFIIDIYDNLWNTKDDVHLKIMYMVDKQPWNILN